VSTSASVDKRISDYFHHHHHQQQQQQQQHAQLANLGTSPQIIFVLVIFRPINTKPQA